MSGNTVKGTITITANASAGSGIAVVEFFIDGATTPLKQEFFAPYEAPWDTTAVANGSHTITAVARDNAGNSTTSAPVTVTVANGDTGGAPPTATRSEESAATFTGTGWTLRGAEIATFSGGTAASSNVGGDTASFTFSGTQVSWIGLKCSVCGIATVSIDGGAPISVDTAGAAAVGSAGLDSEVVFTSPVLTSGTHTLVITVTGNTTSGGAHIIVDAFDVAGGTGSNVIRFEEDNAAVGFSPEWSAIGPEVATFSGNQAGVSASTGATATFTFTGTAVSWIGLKCNVCGIANVSIDGGPANPVDTTGPGEPNGSLTSEVVFSASGLAAGTHTLLITVTGTPSGGANIVVDAFDVTP
jgi:hypothetical protein